MNTTMIARIAWKEYRQQIAFFAVMLVLTIAIQLLFATVYIDSVTPAMVFFYLFGVAGGFASLYAVACGATLYATEKEMGTYQNLQLLPVNSRQVLAGKAGVAALFCLAFLLIATIIGVITSWIMNVEIVIFADHTATQLSWFGAMAIVALAILELFAWGWFYSLITKRPLVAAVLGILTSSVVISVLVQVSIGNVYDAFSVVPYVSIWPARLLIALLVIAADVSLSWNWLQGSTRTRTESRQRVGTAETVRRLPSVRTSTLLARLMWQTVRTSWRLMLVYLLSIGLSVLIFFSGFPMFGIAGAMLSSGVAGVFAFLPDQSQSSYRFLANLGERPTLIWISRMIPWMAVVVLVNCIGWAFWFGLTPGLGEGATYFYPIAAYQQLATENQDWLRASGTLWTMIVFAVGGGIVSCVAFSAGAFCSTLFRSSVIAGVVGSAFGLLASAWCVFTFAAATPWWSYIGIGVAFLVAGRLAVSPWLSQRSIAARWGMPLGVAAALIGIVASATVWYRANEIPEVHASTPVASFNASNLEEVRNAYAGALSDYKSRQSYPYLHESFRTMDDEQVRLLFERDLTQFLSESSETTQKLLSAISLGEQYRADLEACPPFYGGQTSTTIAPPIEYFATNSVIDLLTLHARHVMEAGEVEESWILLEALLKFLRQYSFVYPEDAHEGVDEAMKYIGQWALLESQTEESLLKACHVLFDHNWLLQSNQRRLQAQTTRMHDLIDRGEIHRDHKRMGMNKFVLDINQRAVLWLPWERQRAHRFVDLASSVMTRRNEVRETTLFYGSRERFRPTLERDVQQKLSTTWPVTTLWPEEKAQSSTSFFAEWTPRQLSGLIYSQYEYRTEAEQLRRMTMLKLVLLAWQQKNGQLPDSLRAISWDAYGRPDLETDSSYWTGTLMLQPGAARAEFDYFVDGLPHKIGVQGDRNSPSYTIPANVPFICNMPIPARTEDSLERDPDDDGNYRVKDRWYVVDRPGGFGTFIMPLK